MVSSVLSPEKVVGRQNTNKAAAQNFISGGSVVGASVVNSAANKIVGFQRTGVQPAPSAAGSIVSTISTNINNNVTSTINKTLQGFSADYQKRLKQVDDAKPIGILGKFLNVYNTALGFINFFGNKRNIDKVRDNLKVLQKSFTESFEVAKLIRQVIIKIVKQLSNLPVASPSGGGGLNLDVDIPGGGLKKSAPKGLGRMMKGKGKMLALGAGALGLGALGAGAVNALSDSPQAQAAGTSSEIPGDTVDKFSSIVDKFANAISKLFVAGKTKPKQQTPGSAKGAAKPPGPPSGPGAGPSVPSPGSDALGNVKGGKLQGISNEDYKYLGMVAGGEAGPGDDPYAVAASVLNRMASGRGNSVKDVIMSPGQYAAVTGSGAHPGFSPKLEAMFKSPEGQAKMVAALERLQGRTDFKGQKELKNRVATEDPMVDTKGNYYHYSYQTSKNSVAPAGWSQPNWQKFVAQSNTTSSAPKGGIAATPSPAQVAAAPAQSAAQQQIAQKVAQPAVAPQSVVMPINLGGGGQQQTGGGGGTSGPPPSQGSGPSVPFLPAGNPDNFLVLYSRMVYNIVDG
jgi:Cell Wall Hydrolase